MEDHAPADQAPPVDRHIGIEDGILANDGVMVDANPGIEDDAPLHFRPVAHINAGVQGCLFGNIRVMLHKRVRAASRERCLFGMKEGQRPAEGHIGVVDDQQVFPRAFHAGRHKDP